MEKLTKICLLIITFAIVMGIIFYCWAVYKEQKFYSQRQECIEKCFKEGDEKDDLSDRLENCEKICNYEFISSKIISD